MPRLGDGTKRKPSPVAPRSPALRRLRPPRARLPLGQAGAPQGERPRVARAGPRQTGSAPTAEK